MTNWKLLYKADGDGAMQFAELLVRDGESTLRKGAVFTHGTVEQVASFDTAERKLMENGYQLQRDWHFDRENRDYSLLEKELASVISADPEFPDSNALAIVTDSCFMTVGFALHQFEDIESADDEELWIVDEWGDWNDDWQLDPAYRWIVGYGYNDQLDGEEHNDFCDHVRKSFLTVLKSFASTKDILLIYVGGDDSGHQWSAECMDEELARRMLEWI